MYTLKQQKTKNPLKQRETELPLKQRWVGTDVKKNAEAADIENPLKQREIEIPLKQRWVGNRQECAEAAKRLKGGKVIDGIGCDRYLKIDSCKENR